MRKREVLAPLYQGRPDNAGARAASQIEPESHWQSELHPHTQMRDVRTFGRLAVSQYRIQLRSLMKKCCLRRASCIFVAHRYETHLFRVAGKAKPLGGV